MKAVTWQLFEPTAFGDMAAHIMILGRAFERKKNKTKTNKQTNILAHLWVENLRIRQGLSREIIVKD